MKRNRFFTYGRILMLTSVGVGAMFFSSCAQDGFDDESFSSGVTNTTLVSPDADSITVTPNADGSKSTITWPVVFGAGGYEVTLYNVTDPNKAVVVDSFENDTIDRCTIVASREADMNYKLVIKTLGNTKYNNKDADASTEKSFSSFVNTYATIPAGSDISEYFTNNPVPDTTAEMCYDLEPGMSYTMSSQVDFGDTQVTLCLALKKVEWIYTYPCS